MLFGQHSSYSLVCSVKRPKLCHHHEHVLSKVLGDLSGNSRTHLCSFHLHQQRPFCSILPPSQFWLFILPVFSSRNSSLSSLTLHGFSEYTIYFDSGGGASGKEPTCQCRRHESWVQSLSLEDLLEEGMTTHSSILVYRIPWTEEPGRLQSMELKRDRRD